MTYSENLRFSAPAIYKLGPNDLLKINGRQYRLEETTPVVQILFDVDKPSIRETFSHAEFHALTKRQDFQHERDWFAPQRIKMRGESQDELLSRLPDAERRLAQFRYELCFRSFQKKIKLSDPKIKIFLAEEIPYFLEINNKKGKRAGNVVDVMCMPSPKTFRKWLKRLLEGGMHPYALRPLKRVSSRHMPRVFNAEDRQFMKNCARSFANKKRPSAHSIYERYKKAGDWLNERRRANRKPPLRIASWGTFYKEISNLDKFEVMAARYGVATAKNYFQMVGDGLFASRVGEITQMDDFREPLITILEQIGAEDKLTDEEREKLVNERYWGGMIMDTASRYVLGFRSAETPTMNHSLELLRMSVTDKTALAKAVGCKSDWAGCVSPEKLYTDQHKSYTGEAFRLAALDLGIKLVTPAAGEPKGRPYIERLIGNIQSSAYSMLSGRTFGSIKEKGEHDPVADAAHIAADVTAMIIRYIVDVYHHTPHKGLGGETPYNAFHRLARERMMVPPPSASKRRAVLGLQRTAKLQRMGVQFLGIWYVPPGLQEHVNEKGFKTVEIRLDPADLGTASVRLGDDWVNAPSRDPKFHGVSLMEWLEVVAELRRRYAKQASHSSSIVHAALEDIQAMDDAARVRAGHAGRDEIQAMIDKAEASMPKNFSIFDDRDALASDDTDPLSRTVTPAVPLPRPTAPAQPSSNADESGDDYEIL